MIGDERARGLAEQANNASLDDFMGLSPYLMHQLLYHTYEDTSPVHLREVIDEDALDKIPLFRIIEEYLRIIEREGSIKLTPLGALQKKVVVELYYKRCITEDSIENGISKLHREQDAPAIVSARHTAQLAGLVRSHNGRLFLTTMATSLLTSNDRVSLFRKVIQAFTNAFNWSYNDGYEPHRVAQVGWGYSLWLLATYGNQPLPMDFYAQKYLRAFPMFLSEFQTTHRSPIESFVACYSLRTFIRGFNWLGFVNIVGRKTMSKEGLPIVVATDLVKRVFTINIKV